MIEEHVRILIAEDRRETLESLADLISDLDVIPVLADSKVEAERIWEQDLDLRLALLDLGLPNDAGEVTVESGFSLLNDFHNRVGSHILIHSGFSDPGFRKRAQESGAADYLTKDVAPQELIERIRGIVAIQREWLAKSQRSLLFPLVSVSTRIGEADKRHFLDRHWFLSDPSMWSDRQQLVVAVFNQTILGQGPGYVEAYRDAQRRCEEASKPCPGRYDITFVIVPDVVDPEPAPDWNPMAHT